MIVLAVKNVHDALHYVMGLLNDRAGIIGRDSRNGEVLKFQYPVTTVYSSPLERVIFWKERDANPFFHLMESLWMLAGRNDVEFVAQYVNRMRTFSDDGVTLHGAYGYRWRKWFACRDQLKRIAEMLRKNPDDRRAVLQMWDANSDVYQAQIGGKDVPCNLIATFNVEDGRLDMTVFNRSNDIIWGAYGANAVHFSYLQEYMAYRVGVKVGTYYQISTNFHAYKDTYEQVKAIGEQPHYDPYGSDVEPFPLIRNLDDWHNDLIMFMDEPEAIGFKEPFFKHVAVPMAAAHKAYKEHRGIAKFEIPAAILGTVKATDWKRAALEWLDRRHEKWLKQQDDGVEYENG